MSIRTNKVIAFDSEYLGSEPDAVAAMVADRFGAWDNAMTGAKAAWAEVRTYVFATDTFATLGPRQMWSNNTTIPKVCQIHDTLSAVYLAAMFPRRSWLTWEGASEDDEDDKASKVESYMRWVVSKNEFIETMGQLVQDYVLTGNVFVTYDWVDDRTEQQSTGYVGPAAKRIAARDIKFDVTAPSFKQAGKVVRSLVSLGQAKAMVESLSGDKVEAGKIWEQMTNLRSKNRKYKTLTLGSGTKPKNNFGTTIPAGLNTISGLSTQAEAGLGDLNEQYFMDGFSSYSSYLESGTAELLTFYGDYYDTATDTLETNRRVVIIDRRILISSEPIKTADGLAPIYHVGWRKRPDNLVAMGPLENILGMQYRIDHLENLKSDALDMFLFPVLKIKGDVPDFTWAPFERIYVGDSGDVSVVQNNVGQFLQLDNQIGLLEKRMDEAAGAPREAAGIRSPGEKTAFEVRELGNASNRLFQHKIAQFERELTEPLVNAMLGLAKENIVSQNVRSFDKELNIAIFDDITEEDLNGAGTLKPVAARNFAEKALKVQELNQFFSSPAGQDPEIAQHFSAKKLAAYWEVLLDIEADGIVQPYVRVAERVEAEQFKNAAMAQLKQEAQDMGVDDGGGEEVNGPQRTALGDTAPRGSTPKQADPLG